MLKNAFSIFARNLKSRRTFTIINIIGLGLGICFSGLIYLYIKNEESFDQFHKNKARIFRIESNIYNEESATGDNFRGLSELPDPLIESIRAQVPEIQFSSRMRNSLTDGIVKYKSEVFAEKITYVDNEFLKIFSFSVLKGDIGSSTENNLSAIITKSIADKYFKSEDPIGKIILIEGEGESEKLYKVAAIVEDPPANSSINFNILVPVVSWKYYEDYTTEWSEYTYSFFVLLNENVEEDFFKQKLNKVAKNAMKDPIAEFRAAMQIPNSVKEVFYLSCTKLPLIHWNTRIAWEGTSSRQNVYILLGIAAIIILVSSINFVSIALTRSFSRGMEVGVRKVSGASRLQLRIQFILESFATTLIAGLLGLTLLMLFSTKFNSYIGKDIVINFDYVDVISFVCLIGSITILNGFYPAFIISSVNPALVLRSRFNLQIKTGFATFLVVLQFTLSLFLATCATFMFYQMKFINSKELGFNKYQVVSIPTYAPRSETNLIVDRFKQMALQDRGVVSVAGVSRSFFKGISNMGYVNFRGEKKSAKVYSVDADYLRTLGIRLVSGRDFDEKRKTDERSIIVNESLASEIADNGALGHHLKWGGQSDSSEIIGIVKDFHFRSMERPIEPLFLTMNYTNSAPLQSVLIRLSGDPHQTILNLKKIWKEVNPGKPFEVSFLEDDMAKQYAQYIRWSRIVSISTAFAFVITCIGLFGLAGIDTIYRYHELGVRKTFGASVFKLVTMLNGRYLGVIAISSCLAIPASYYAMSEWLKYFAYRVPLDWVVFVQVLVSATCVVLLTVSYHTLKGAMVSPAKILRHE